MEKKPEQQSALQMFHLKIVDQLSYQLRRYQSAQQNKTLLPLTLSQTEQNQHFTPESISQFLYDILQLENSSIEFIMKQIFDSAKRTSWHLEQILKIVLDVQLVITVNNFIVSKHQNINQQKIKQKQISFLKIQPHQLVDIIYQNCFFLQNSLNAISRDLITQIVQQINTQNGNKGHILLVEYKTFMFNNMIEKHSLRKFLTPKKPKAPTPVNRVKFNENSDSIKEVDEQSQAMGRSNRNFSSISLRQDQLKLDEFSNIKNEQRKDLIAKEKQMAAQSKHPHKQIQLSSIVDQFHTQLWDSINQMISEFTLKLNIKLNQIQKEQFVSIVQTIISTRLTHWEHKYLQRIIQKMRKISKVNTTHNQRVSTLIRLIGEQGFKIYHDTMMQHTGLNSKFTLQFEQVLALLSNTYAPFLEHQIHSKTLQKLSEFLTGEELDQKQQETSVWKPFTFVNYLHFVETVSIF